MEVLLKSALDDPHIEEVVGSTFNDSGVVAAVEETFEARVIAAADGPSFEGLSVATASAFEDSGIAAASIMLLLIMPNREPHSSDISIQEISSSNVSGDTGKFESITSATLPEVTADTFSEWTTAGMACSDAVVEECGVRTSKEGFFSEEAAVSSVDVTSSRCG